MRSGGALVVNARPDRVADLFFNLAGLDETSSQAIRARQVYSAAGLRWGREFIDMFSPDGQRRRHGDFSKIRETRVAMKKLQVF